VVPHGAGAAVGAVDKAVEIVAECGHEPQGDVDVDCKLVVGRVGRGGALLDMI
jgi:hypothetical protein